MPQMEQQFRFPALRYINRCVIAQQDLSTSSFLVRFYLTQVYKMRFMYAEEYFRVELI
jgi:hypothetical protein